MLNPSSNRTDYGEMLKPPAGFKLEFAVGTTYSLDMDVLIAMCITLGLSENTDSQLMNNPVYLLEALKQTADKVAIFCESGQIVVPASLSSLYVLLEKIVFQVSIGRNAKMKDYPAFHPKFWLLKYKSEDGQLKYRAIVLSRNMTFDRSWDISAMLDGSPGGMTRDHSVPVSDFVGFLSAQVRGSDRNSKLKRRMLNTLAQEILDVSFELNNKNFTDFEFIPLGIWDEKGERYNIADYSLFADSFHEIFIISPFVSDSIIRDFNERNRVIVDPDCTLITRKSSLQKLKPKHCDRFKIFTLKDAIVDGESCLSDDTSDIQMQDIHAKLYLRRKYSMSELYLGSMNATHSAVNRNVEFILRLVGPNRFLNADILKKDLFGNDPDGKENPFEETTIPLIPPDEATDEENILERKIKELCRSNPRAEVRESEDRYDIHIWFEKLGNTEGLTISPMLTDKPLPVRQHVVVTGLDVSKLSCFYHVAAQSENLCVHRVIKIDTANIPEQRESAIIKNIISDQRSFIEYISFLLGDDFLMSLLETTKFQQSKFFINKNGLIAPAVYERMLRTAARAPERFKEIDYIIRMLSDSNVIPEGFEKLYKTFRKVVG